MKWINEMQSKTRNENKENDEEEEEEKNMKYCFVCRSILPHAYDRTKPSE